LLDSAFCDLLCLPFHAFEAISQAGLSDKPIVADELPMIPSCSFCIAACISSKHTTGDKK
jgi:hypothetical protein